MNIQKSLITIALAFIGSASQGQQLPQTPPEATSSMLAQRLLNHSSQSVERRRLGLALLQFSQAQRLDSAAAQAGTLEQQLHTLLDEEAKIMERGQLSARRLDRAAVESAIAELYKLDVESSAAVELALQFNALMADRGGIVQRLALKK